MKVIECDNYNRESDDFPDEWIISFSIPEKEARQIASILNKVTPDDGDSHFKIVPDDYVLNDYSPL